MKKKNRILLLGVLLSPALIWGAWQYNKPYEQREFERRIDAFIKSGQTEVLLSELTDFKWDEVCVVPPYGGLPPMKRWHDYTLIGAEPYSDDDGKWFTAYANHSLKELIVIRMPVYYSNDSQGCCQGAVSLHLSNNYATFSEI